MEIVIVIKFKIQIKIHANFIPSRHLHVIQTIVVFKDTNHNELTDDDYDDCDDDNDDE